jgi:hypothetical protein
MSIPYNSAQRVRVRVFADTVNIELVRKLGLSDITLYDLRFESPTDRMFLGETKNSFTSVSLEVEILDIEVIRLLAIVI